MVPMFPPRWRSPSTLNKPQIFPQSLRSFPVLSPPCIPNHQWLQRCTLTGLCAQCRNARQPWRRGARSWHPTRPPPFLTESSNPTETLFPLENRISNSLTHSPRSAPARRLQSGKRTKAISYSKKSVLFFLERPAFTRLGPQWRFINRDWSCPFQMAFLKAQSFQHTSSNNLPNFTRKQTFVF